MIEMFVAGIALDARNGHPIVILNDSARRRALPIWIGTAEASAIGRALEELKTERPLTHDLLLNIIANFGFAIESVEINEIAAETYLSTITLTPLRAAMCCEASKRIDARPSDAIALALKSRAPIYVSTQVVAEGTIAADFTQDEAEAAEFKRFLEGLKASDFAATGVKASIEPDSGAQPCPAPAPPPPDEPGKPKSPDSYTSDGTDECLPDWG